MTISSSVLSPYVKIGTSDFGGTWPPCPLYTGLAAVRTWQASVPSVLEFESLGAKPEILSLPSLTLDPP